jgi:hypothetical protein
MPSPNQTHVEFGAKIPPDLYRRFKQKFDIYGASTWFINKSLEAFMDTVEANPDLEEIVFISIDQMLQERRNEATSD